MIVCGVDGSSCAARAAWFASDLAVRLEVPLLLLYVAPPPWVAPTTADWVERTEEETAFERAGHLATVLDPIEVNAAATVHRIVEFGDPVEVLRSVAADAGATEIVAGTQGQGAITNIIAGSTSAALARDAPCPVILVSPRAPERLNADEPLIVAGVDTSDASLAAARLAGKLAQRLRGRLLLAHVLDHAPSDDEGYDVLARAEARAPDVPLAVERLHGRARDELLVLGRRTNATLLAVGATGRGAVVAAVLGSVSHDLVQNADRPVMIVSRATVARALP